MSRALELAELGRYSTHPNPRVGCVITLGGQVVGTGRHEQAGAPHAEINAINDASCDLQGAAAYVSLEPCAHQGRTPPCAAALVAAGVRRVVIAAPDPNPRVAGRGVKALAAAGISVETGLLADEANELNKGFIRRMTRRRPYVRCKSAISLDGKTALANGAARWITGAAARLDGHRLRAASSALATGSGTVLADDPLLTVRGVDTGGRRPLRVVLDRRLRFPATAAMLGQPGTIILFANGRQGECAAPPGGIDVRFIDADADGFLDAMLGVLAEEYEVNDLLVEAGPTLSGAMLAADLVDELVVYQAPVILGAAALDMMRLPPLSDLAEKRSLELVERRRLGDDWRYVFKPVKRHE